MLKAKLPGWGLPPDPWSPGNFCESFLWIRLGFGIEKWPGLGEFSVVSVSHETTHEKSFKISMPNMTGQRLQRTTEAIPRRPWKSKRSFVSKPMKTGKNKGTQGVHVRYDTVVPPLIYIVWSPSLPVISVPSKFRGHPEHRVRDESSQDSGNFHSATFRPNPM